MGILDANQDGYIALILACVLVDIRRVCGDGCQRWGVWTTGCGGKVDVIHICGELSPIGGELSPYWGAGGRTGVSDTAVW